MKTIKITNENDYAQIFSKRCGCHCAAKSKNALTHLCEDIIPAASERYTNIDELNTYCDHSFALITHIKISKKNAREMDKFFLNYEAQISDYEYLDGYSYDLYDDIDDCPSDIVDFTFIPTDLFILDEIINKAAIKLQELGESTELRLNFIFTDGEGIILDANGNEINDGYEPAFIWKLANGVVEKPNCRMVIYGDDVDNLLYYGCHLFTDFSVSDWRNVFGVEIEVGFKDEND